MQQNKKIMHRVKLVCFYTMHVCIIFIFSGCGGLKQKSAAVASSNKDACATVEYCSKSNLENGVLPYKELTEEERARLLDIPFPIDIHPLKVNGLHQNNKIILTYNTGLSLFEIIDYYRAEMDYWGWQEIDHFSADVCYLLFKKPTKQCAITITPLYEGCKTTRYTIFLFIGQKNKIPT